MRQLLLIAPLFASVLLAQSNVMTNPPDLAQLQRMASRFARTPLKVDTSHLSAGDRKALVSLIEAAREVDHLFLEQYWTGDEALYHKLEGDTSPLGKERLRYFWLNKGPWSSLDAHAAFLPGVPLHKPEGAAFYPEDMTRQEFETWVKTLPEAQHAQATGFFSVIRRNPQTHKLETVPYHQAYAARLQRLAELLRNAANQTDNASLKKFLQLRADAFLSDDYYASDLAWMDLDAPLDVTIGPYETYNDELFGYKASFEAYISVRDEAETGKLRFFADHLQDVENHLPIDSKYKNPKLGASAPITVVNQIIASGDAAHGVQTAAYNLPNDERVIQQKGSKRVMLKNVQEAKFHAVLEPIASKVLSPEARKDLSFDLFFTHILAHELSHGIGPHQIQVNGRSTSPRQEMKELYSAIEEAKADITGLYMLQYLHDAGQLPQAGPNFERQLYTSFLASSFRTLRFGMKEAHARGMAMQLNYLLDKGGFRVNPGGTFAVDFAKIKDAVKGLTGEILTLEATGDYKGAKRMLDTLAVLRPEVEKALSALTSIPTDIEPVAVTADQISPAGK